MVMRRNMMRRNLWRSVGRSMGRFLAIVAIIALGCAMFVGMRITKTDMVATGQKYTDKQNMFDLRLLNTYGWSKEDVAKIAQMDGVCMAEGSVTVDAFVQIGDGEAQVYRLYSMPDKINQVYLLGGRMPQKEDECLIDGMYADDSVIGSRITLTDANSEDTFGQLSGKTFTVVGYVSTPLYMDINRGSTTLGSGVLSSYAYIPAEAFLVDYYTEINITMDGSRKIYEESYNDAMDALAEKLEPSLKELADERFAQLRSDGEAEYTEGIEQYEQGLAEYEKAKSEVMSQLQDALQKLQSAQKELDENRQKLVQGEVQLNEGLAQWEKQQESLKQGMQELEKQKADAYTQLAQASMELTENYKTVSEALKKVTDAISQLEDGITQVEDSVAKGNDDIAQIEENLATLDMTIVTLEGKIAETSAALGAARDNPLATQQQIQMLEQQLEEQRSQQAQYIAQRNEALEMQELLQQQMQELQSKRQELESQKTELLETEKTLTESMDTIEEGMVELESRKFQADNQFAAALAELNAGQLQLDSAKKLLDEKKQELDDGKTALSQGELQLDEAMAQYETGKAEAEAELQEAETELNDAKRALDDARQTLESMDEATVYALTRNTNAGYLALDSNSDIVSGVATVLPIFFLLIAALVCITTMTRMVEEERTQIGTLKAMGYSNSRIMSKYLIYSGIASIIGCVVGVTVGSTFFPVLLWNAYGIIFNITPEVELTFDWQLSVGITVAYLAVSSLVTWYCCRRTLREVPAQLIRPKAPTTGKKILLEYFPFWKKLSFLNKVMLRNVFRYRQRFLMMLIGIGGCTALLLTGFGLRDTIVDVANIQFEEVNLYDMEVYFSEGQSPSKQQAFTNALGTDAKSVCFFYQNSVELDFDGAARDVYMIAAEDDINDFIDFHRGQEQVALPGKGEAILSVGVAELLGIRVGDTVTVRNSDMQSLVLTISGIYDNHVSNYLITNLQTLEQQWGQAPAKQMAFVTASDATKIHDLSGTIMGLDGVMNISVCEDTAELVDSMMEALNLVVLVIVVSAGLLAAIVLYNLTNININERIREIATIKVLGFHAAETSAYVFKENMLLTVFGAVFGLGLGKVFLIFVMSKIKIDFVWFQTRLAVPSYIYSVILTLLCAIFVAFVFHRRLQKINMAEALKSVE